MTILVVLVAYIGWMFSEAFLKNLFSLTEPGLLTCTAGKLLTIGF